MLVLLSVKRDVASCVPGETDLQCVPGRFESVEEYVRVFEPLLFEECRAQLYSTWEELSETFSRDTHVMVRVRNIERRERGNNTFTKLEVFSFSGIWNLWCILFRTFYTSIFFISLFLCITLFCSQHFERVLSRVESHYGKACCAFAAAVVCLSC